MALLYFLLGILFAYIAIPCLEALVELIASWIEVKKIKQAEIINNYNIQMAEQTQDLDRLKIVVPGFAPPEEIAKDEEKL